MRVETALELVMAFAVLAVGSSGARLAEQDHDPSRAAIFGDQRVCLESNAAVDSYDSSVGSYASQATNGNGNGTYAGEAGNVGSNGDINLSQNAEVHGDTRCGPLSTTTISGNATVSGSTAPSPHEFRLPRFEVPQLPSSGALLVPSSTTLTLPSGDHRFDRVQVGAAGVLRVAGPARLVLGSLAMAAGARLVIEASEGTVEIYLRGGLALGPSVRIGSQSPRPADLRLFLQADTRLDQTGRLYADVVAPGAAVELDGGFALFGRLTAASVELDGWSRVHVDEALVGWRSP